MVLVLSFVKSCLGFSGSKFCAPEAVDWGLEAWAVSDEL